MFFRHKAADPLASRRLLCAYCTSDYLDWERDPREGASPPVVNPAVTVLPATVEGQEGGAALCVTHLRPMLRIRRTLAECPRERPPGAFGDGAPPVPGRMPRPVFQDPPAPSWAPGGR